MSVARLLLSDSTRLGFIGLGVMGGSVAKHLHAKRKNPLIIYNRTRSKCSELEEKGVRVAASVAEVAQNSDVVFLMTSMPEDVIQVVEEAKDGLMSNFGDLDSPRVIIDMSTSPPSMTKEIAERCLTAGNVRFVDAPVSGGDVGARNGTLSIMFGGDEETLTQIKPLFEVSVTDSCLSFVLTFSSVTVLWLKNHALRSRRLWAINQDGQPDSDRNQHDRCL